MKYKDLPPIGILLAIQKTFGEQKIVSYVADRFDKWKFMETPFMQIRLQHGCNGFDGYFINVTSCLDRHTKDSLFIYREEKNFFEFIRKK